MPEFDLSRDEFRDVEPPAVVRLTAPVDAPKPLAAYSALRTEYSFLLESAETDISALKQVGAGGKRRRRTRPLLVRRVRARRRLPVERAPRDCRAST